MHDLGKFYKFNFSKRKSTYGKNKQNINILLSAIISSVLFGCGSGGTSVSPNSTNMATNKSDLASKSTSITEINLCSSFPKWERVASTINLIKLLAIMVNYI